MYPPLVPSFVVMKGVDISILMPVMKVHVLFQQSPVLTAYWTVNSMFASLCFSLSYADDLQGRFPKILCVCEPSFRLGSEFRLLDERRIGHRRRAVVSSANPAGLPSAPGLWQSGPSAPSPPNWEFGNQGTLSGNSYGRKGDR